MNQSMSDAQHSSPTSRRRSNRTAAALPHLTAGTDGITALTTVELLQVLNDWRKLTRYLEITL